MRGRVFRIATATIAIETGEKTTRIPAGSIITVLSDPNESKLVYVLYEGHRVQMFAQDVRERGRPIVTDQDRGDAAAG